MRRLVVSLSGEPHGFVDDALAAQGLKRRVAVTVPNFMFALNVVAETDHVCAVPRRFAAVHAARFGLATSKPPVPLGEFKLNLVVPEVALMDAGLAWLAKRVLETGRSKPAAAKARQGAYINSLISDAALSLSLCRQAALGPTSSSSTSWARGT